MGAVQTLPQSPSPVLRLFQERFPYRSAIVCRVGDFWTTLVIREPRSWKIGDLTVSKMKFHALEPHNENRLTEGDNDRTTAQFCGRKHALELPKVVLLPLVQTSAIL